MMKRFLQCAAHRLGYTVFSNGNAERLVNERDRYKDAYEKTRLELGQTTSECNHYRQASSQVLVLLSQVQAQLACAYSFTSPWPQVCCMHIGKTAG